MNGIRSATLVLLVALWGAAWSAVAQPTGPTPPLPTASPPMAPVVPDTVEIVVAVPDSLPQPLAVHVLSDTLQFGGLLNVVLEYGPDQSDPTAIPLQAEGDWLVPNTPPRPGLWARLLGHRTEPAPDLSALPATDGQQVIRSFRVYRRDPLRIRWRDYLSPVLTVVGQAEGTERIAAIRDPRRLRWVPWQLLALVVTLLVVGLISRWWWRRRRQPEPLSHWPVASPPWLDLAVALKELLAADPLAKGESRRYLDRLVALAREYVAIRYRIPAREMTGREIARACIALGHDPAHPRGFANLIDVCDKARYNPLPPDPAFCREQAVQLLGRVHRVRLDTRYAAVAPDRLLAGQKAWAELVADLGLGAGRAVPSVGGEVR